MMQVLSIDNTEQQKKAFLMERQLLFQLPLESFHNEGYLDQHFPPPPKKERGSEGRKALKN